MLRRGCHDRELIAKAAARRRTRARHHPCPEAHAQARHGCWYVAPGIERRQVHRSTASRARASRSNRSTSRNPWKFVRRRGAVPAFPGNRVDRGGKATILPHALYPWRFSLLDPLHSSEASTPRSGPLSGSGGLRPEGTIPGAAAPPMQRISSCPVSRSSGSGRCLGRLPRGSSKPWGNGAPKRADAAPALRTFASLCAGSCSAP